MNFPHSQVLGVLLSGGMSERMGQSKALINYHGIPQWLYGLKQLQELCADCRISIQSDQQKQSLLESNPSEFLHHFSLEFLVDLMELGTHGPATAFYSMAEFLGNSAYDFVVVLGVDYPAITSTDLIPIVEHALNTGKISAFRNPEDGGLEPLIACYPKQRLIDYASFHRGNPHASPRKFFQSLNPALFDPLNSWTIQSVDTPEALQAMQLRIQNNSVR